MKTIAVLATLDTKGAEAQFMREQIQQQGAQALLIDMGIVGDPGTQPDVRREEVAEQGGTTLAEILKNPTRQEASPVMVAGATAIINKAIAPAMTGEAFVCACLNANDPLKDMRMVLDECLRMGVRSVSNIGPSISYVDKDSESSVVNASPIETMSMSSRASLSMSISCRSEAIRLPPTSSILRAARSMRRCTSFS